MKYIVDEKFLNGFKQLVERYTVHDVQCSWHMTECCDCGLARLRNELHDMESTYVTFYYY
jgi:hypothetical protein